MNRIRLLVALSVMFIVSAVSQTLPDSVNGMPKIDTTKVYISLIELRTISDYLKEVQYRRANDSTYKAQINIYESLIMDFNGKEKMYLQKIDNLEREVKLATPPFWDHFYIGAITGVTVTGGVILTVVQLLKSLK